MFFITVYLQVLYQHDTGFIYFHLYFVEWNNLRAGLSGKELCLQRLSGSNFNNVEMLEYCIRVVMKSTVLRNH